MLRRPLLPVLESVYGFIENTACHFVRSRPAIARIEPDLMLDLFPGACANTRWTFALVIYASDAFDYCGGFVYAKLPIADPRNLSDLKATRVQQRC